MKLFILCLLLSYSICFDIPKVKLLNDIGIYEINVSHQKNCFFYSSINNTHFEIERNSTVEQQTRYFSLFINSQFFIQVNNNQFYPVYIQSIVNKTLNSIEFSSLFLEEECILLKNTFENSWRQALFNQSYSEEDYSFASKSDMTKEYKGNIPKRKYLALLQNIYSRNYLYYPNINSIEELVFISKRILHFLRILNNHEEVGKKLIKKIFSEFDSDFGGYSNGTSQTEIVNSLKTFSSKTPVYILMTIHTEKKYIFNEINYIMSILRILADIIYDININKITYENQILIDTLSLVIGEDFMKYRFEMMNSIFSSQVTAPFKKIERGRFQKKRVPLSGIFGYGNFIDNYFFRNIAVENRIKPFSWKACTIVNKKYESVVEPMTSHISGSIANNLFVANLFLNVNTYKILTNQVNHSDIKNNKFYMNSYLKSRISYISSNLMANGYHSALELIETTYNILNYKTRFVSLINNNNADSIIKYNDNNRHLLFPLKNLDTSDSKFYNSGHSTLFLIDIINSSSTVKLNLFNIDKKIKANKKSILRNIKKVDISLDIDN